MKLPVDKIKQYLPPAIIGIVILSITIPLLWRHISWYLKSDAEKIEIIVEQVITAASHRNIRSMLHHVSDDYSDIFHADKDKLHRNLQAMWFRYKAVKVTLRAAVVVTVDKGNPNLATADFQAEVLLGTSHEQQPADRMVENLRGSDRFRLYFRKEDGDWRVIRSAVP